MIKKIVLSLMFISAFGVAVAAPKDTPPRPTKAINEYINHMVKKYKFNKKKLTALMDQAQYDPKVIHSITYPFEKKPWDFYRAYFLRKDRIENGVKYWETHKKTLKDIQKRYGVPPSIVIAIIGIESYYGEHAGRYNELNALTTLSFYYPKRAKFFKSELTHFLLLTRHEKLNPLTLKGSYAGALGIPQFMPSSYRHYGVDYANDQSINLFTNHLDAMASIANYLNRAGWVQNKPIAVPAKILRTVPKQFISNNAKPKYTLRQFRHYHVRPVEKMPGHLKAALITMRNTHSTEYWLVFRNFRAIMRYNPRTTYALAVFELSRAIKENYERELTATRPPTPPARKATRSRRSVPTAPARKSRTT